MASLVPGKQILTSSGTQPVAVQQAGGQQMKITLPVQANQTVRFLLDTFVY